MSQTIQSPAAPSQTIVPPAATPQTPPPALVVTRTYAAPRERVFKAWTDAGQLSRWFSPTDDYTTKAQVDLRVGGAYRIEITHSGGNTHTVIGTYREINPPSRLSFTWNWEGSPAAVDTLVTIDFAAAGDSTLVTMTHEKLPTLESREQHEKGWIGCMSRLERKLESEA
jgi:uncharacterized protein YndB with AHSA1/START domain